MAEKIISAGVFTNEIDQTFLPAAVADIGAALIGPTVKGPAGMDIGAKTAGEIALSMIGEVIAAKRGRL